MKYRWFVSGAVAIAAVGRSGPSVSADPKPNIAVTLTCDGQDYDIVVAGNGAWTPAHDLNSTLVGVPIAFGEFTGVFTPTVGAPSTSSACCVSSSKKSPPNPYPPNGVISKSCAEVFVALASRQVTSAVAQTALDRLQVMMAGAQVLDCAARRL